MDDLQLLKQLRQLCNESMEAMDVVYAEGVHSDKVRKALWAVQKRAMQITGARKQLSRDLEPVERHDQEERPPTPPPIQVPSPRADLPPLYVPDPRQLHTRAVSKGRFTPCKRCGMDSWRENEVAVWCGSCEEKDNQK